MSIRRVNGPEGHNWFGYYDMPCWDASGRYLLFLNADFADRPPTADDVARVCVADLETDLWQIVAETRAWNWQQGAMLRWLPTPSGREILYNDRLDDRFVAVKLDIDTGQCQIVGRATSDVGQGGEWALALNFARIAQTRPGYGYAGLADPFAGELRPEQDGLWAYRLANGQERLIVSMAQAYEVMGSPGEIAPCKMWFNHTLLNPSETWAAFLVRWSWPESSRWQTMMCVVQPDGAGLKPLLVDGMVSHFDWRDDDTILAWTRIGQGGEHFHEIDIHSGQWQVVGERALTQDGHCSYSRNGRWILTDTYPDLVTYERTLKMHLPDEDRDVVVGRYLSPPPYVGEIRCDLHPRWRDDDIVICFDSVHEGSRQVYVVDTPEL